MSGQRTKIVLSDDFLADLDAVYNAEFRLEVTEVFVGGLEFVHNSDSGDELSPSRLDDLGDKLKAMRLSCRSRLHTYLLRLPPDDPLLCPVSLYGVMDMGRLETAHTRTLAWFLNPSKEHGFGRILVEGLLKHVSRDELLPPFDRYDVQAERSGVQSAGEDVGRTDVWIEGTWEPKERLAKPRPWFVVIEAKIKSEPDMKQLRRYEKIARAREKAGWKGHRILLTPKGHRPEGNGVAKWRGMSFLELARLFRRALDSVRGRPGYQFLRLYIAGVHKDILRWQLPLKAETDRIYEALRYLSEMQTSRQREGDA